MESLQSQIKSLKEEIRLLKNQLKDVIKNNQGNRSQPYSRVGTAITKSQARPIDIKTGFGNTFGGSMIWNNSERDLPRYNQQPAEPTIGYNRHSHGRYSGGALDINTLELVEYATIPLKYNKDGEPTNGDSQGYPVILDARGNPMNKHCQNFWRTDPPIIAEKNSKDENVSRIGLLDITFNPDTKKWNCGGGLAEIDVETTYFVQYAWYKDNVEVAPGTVGATRSIKLDENGNEMKSSLLYYIFSSEDDPLTDTEQADMNNKSNVVWDKDAQRWRFYAVYSD